MSAARLITPDVVEQQIIDLLGRRHDEHLAKLEVERGMAPRTIERLKTVDLLAGSEQRLHQDALPAVLLAMNTATDFTTVRDGSRTTLHVTSRLEMDVVVAGGGRDPRADAMLRTRWTAWTIAECLMARLPRSCDPVESVMPAPPWELEVIPESPALGRAEIAFTVVVADAMTIVGGPLPIDDDSQPPAGTPGGAPADPYEPPEGWPRATDLEVHATRQPLDQE